MAYPIISRYLFIYIATSGSGTEAAESYRIPTGELVPRARTAFDLKAQK